MIFKNQHRLMAISAEHRAQFAAIQWRRRRFHD